MVVSFQVLRTSNGLHAAEKASEQCASDALVSLQTSECIRKRHAAQSPPNAQRATESMYQDHPSGNEQGRCGFSVKSGLDKKRRPIGSSTRSAWCG